MRQVDDQRIPARSSGTSLSRRWLRKTSSKRDDALRQAIWLEEMGIANTCQEYAKPRDEVRCRAERCFSREHQMSMIEYGNMFPVSTTCWHNSCRSRRQVGSSTVLTMKSNTAHEVVKSRGVDRYVTELSAECTQPVHARC